MNLFVRITAVVTVGVVVLILLGFVLKIVIFAAVVAAIVVAGLAVYNRIRGRAAAPLTRYSWRR